MRNEYSPLKKYHRRYQFLRCIYFKSYASRQFSPYHFNSSGIDKSWIRALIYPPGESKLVAITRPICRILQEIKRDILGRMMEFLALVAVTSLHLLNWKLNDVTCWLFSGFEIAGSFNCALGNVTVILLQ